MNFPDLDSTFRTIEYYRHSITTGLLLLYLAPFFFPLGWETVSATWSYVSGLLFFLSLGMIIVRDVWPWVQNKLGIGFTEDSEKAKLIIQKCKEKGGEPPFSLEPEDFDEFERAVDFCRSALNPDDEVSIITEKKIVITAKGLQRLKEQL
jgi:hypothetical protein